MICTETIDPLRARRKYRRIPQRRHHEIVAILLPRQDERCGYCGRVMTPPVGSAPIPTTVTIDHVVPQSRGGTDELANLALACARCNDRKSDLLPDEFLLAARYGLA